MENTRGYIAILSLLVVAIIVVGGAYYVYESGQSTTSTVSVVTPNNAIPEAEPVTSTAEIADCQNQSCFDEKFLNCEPATFYLAASNRLSVSYRIDGPVSGGCKMTLKYPANPNPQWVNKDITCTYNNKMGFTQSVQNTLNEVLSGSNTTCSGPLFDLMVSSQ